MIQITVKSNQFQPEHPHVAEVVSVDGPADAARGRLLLLDQLRALRVSVLCILIWCENGWMISKSAIFNLYVLNRETHLHSANVLLN